jgi:hypothetical protein
MPGYLCEKVFQSFDTYGKIFDKAFQSKFGFITLVA